MYYDIVRNPKGTDVTSAGVNSLGIMPVTVARCNSAAGTLPIK